MDDHSAYSPWIEVYLDNVARNAEAVRRAAGGTPLLAVVKDNAYGLGAVPIARALEKAGVGFFAVARGGEARALRDGGIAAPVLVLGECDSNDLRWGAARDVRFVLNDLADLDRWASLGCPVRCHCLIDTGMHRMGILPDEVSELLRRLPHLPAISIEGVFTHYASADVPNTDTVDHQKRIFRELLARFAVAGVRPDHIHFSNSAGIMRFPDPGCTLARPGITLYGCKPDPAQDFGIALHPVVALKARVAKVKRVPAQTPVSYHGRYTTPHETCIATIPIGYAHGLPRRLTNAGDVLINGRRYRIAGTVTMDYIMVDAGPSPLFSVGDVAAALGPQANDCIGVDDMAAQAHTIGYEILCGLSAVIDRRYLENGRCVLHLPARPF